MNTASRSNLSILVILGLVAISTLVLAASLTSLRVGPDSIGYSAPILFNQGNAAAQQGKTGQAIADYERARLLAPGNADIAANLEYVREHAGLTAASSTWLDLATSFASPNTMALLGWMGLVLTGAGILSARSFSQFRSGFYLAMLTGISLLTLSVLNVTTTWQKYNEAVVLSSDTAARISPVTNGETSFKLKPGEMVTIDGHYNDFALVKNSAGHSGWVAQTNITPLIPQT
jgi:tetratricopeptide (TPR) repeat protein